MHSRLALTKNTSHRRGRRTGGVVNHLPSRQGGGVLPATRAAGGVDQGQDPEAHASWWHGRPWSRDDEHARYGSG